MNTIAKPSVQSLFIQMRVNGHDLGSGTGFVIIHDEKPFLITNWHNLSGRSPTTGQPLSKTGGIPDEVIIIHNRKERLGEWLPKSEKLFFGDSPRWMEHPVHHQKIDVVALPLSDTNDVELYPYSFKEPGPEVMVSPADTVSVVGFPFGLTGGGALAIWATGFMATEPDMNQFGLPAFLIDCRARQGQSGSAVIAHRNGGGVPMKDGGMAIFQGPVTRFLGIYSGRVNAESDLGIVWKTEAISQVVEQRGEQGVPPNA